MVIVDSYTVYGKPLVKRIIAKGGDTISIDYDAGTVTVNGELLQEDYIAAPTYLGYDVQFPFTVPEGTLFVMGDNRNESLDSRSSYVGCIDERDILGKVLLCFMPFTDFGVLLMRFYDADSGSITVDGQEILSLTRASLRRAYSMVLQDTWLFSGTVYENLAYGKEGVTLEQVRAAARAAKIDRFIEALPQGYDTVLRDGGNSISKGQRQLLTIARAMLLDAPMLILDEATSNVDTRTERRIQAAMLRLMEGRTCFVIAHRLSTIRNADVIAVLREGTVAECGTHDELMRRGSYYSELYRAQFDAAQDAG